MTERHPVTVRPRKSNRVRQRASVVRILPVMISTELVKRRAVDYARVRSCLCPSS
jgi:hypothetical protein